MIASGGIFPRWQVVIAAVLSLLTVLALVPGPRMLGWAFEKSRRFKDAAQAYEIALARSPRDAELQRRYVEALSRCPDTGFETRHLEGMATKVAGSGAAGRSPPPFWSALEQRLVTVLLARGQVAQAAEHLARVLKVRPWRLSDHLRLVSLLVQASNLNAAAAELRLIVFREPSNWSLRLRLARVLSWNANKQEAIDQLLAADRLHDSPAIRQAVVQGCLAGNQPGLAALELARWARRDPTDAALWQKLAQIAPWAKRPDLARSALVHLYDLRPWDRQLLLRITAAEIGAHQLAAAQRDLEAWTDRHPADLAVKSQLAQVLGWENLPQEAIAEYENLIRVQPDNPRWRLPLVGPFLGLIPVNQALAQLEWFVRRYPGNGHYLPLLATEQYQAGLPAPSEATWRRYLARHPTDANARYQLGKLLEWDDRPKDSLPLLLGVAQEMQDPISVLEDAAMFASRTEEWGEAELAYGRLTALDPRSADNWRKLAIVQDLRGEVEQALHTRWAWVKEFGRSVQARSQLAYALERARQPLQAARQYQILAAQHPALWKDLWLAAGLLASHGHRAEALPLYRRLLRQFGRNQKILLALATLEAPRHAGRSRALVGRLLQLDPNDTQALALQADLQDGVDDRLALAALQRLEALGALTAQTAYLLGELEEATGKDHLARLAYLKTARMLAHARSRSLLLERAQALTRAHAQGAWSAWVNLLAHPPLSPLAWQGLADYWVERGKPHRAWALLARAKRLYPDNLEIARQQADLAQDQGNSALALKLYTPLLSREPHDGNLRLDTAVAANESGDPSRAWELVHQVEKGFGPDSPEASRARTLSRYLPAARPRAAVRLALENAGSFQKRTLRAAWRSDQGQPVTLEGFMLTRWWNPGLPAAPGAGVKLAWCSPLPGLSLLGSGEVDPTSPRPLYGRLSLDQALGPQATWGGLHVEGGLSRWEDSRSTVANNGTELYGTLAANLDLLSNLSLGASQRFGQLTIGTGPWGDRQQTDLSVRWAIDGEPLAIGWTYEDVAFEGPVGTMGLEPRSSSNTLSLNYQAPLGPFNSVRLAPAWTWLSGQGNGPALDLGLRWTPSERFSFSLDTYVGKASPAGGAPLASGTYQSMMLSASGGL